MPRAARPSIEDRCRELLAFDRACASRLPASPCLVGFDEAGRGAWAGPVAVGCVHVPASLSDQDVVALLSGVDDSKRLSVAARERAFVRIAECARFAVGFASASEIDRVGIVSACRRAAGRAYRRLGVAADLVLCDRGLSLDGPSVPRLEEFTRGDGLSLHIAAASIVAKVSRDARMALLDRTCPGYGFAGHKGYGTKAHRDALLDRGLSRLHRRTYLRGLDEANL